MLMKAFVKLDELRKKQQDAREIVQAGLELKKEDSTALNDLPDNIKLVRADCARLEQHFEDGSFDTVVDTLTLHSVYNRELLADEIKRVCKPGGRILLLERGQSYISLYN